MSDKMDLATDLRRISMWMIKKNDLLVDQFINRDIKMYGRMNFKIGTIKIVEWLQLILDRANGREKAAERALTAAVILSKS
jgi:hypothetical protein